MKKIMMFAIIAIMAVNVVAQEQKNDNAASQERMTLLFNAKEKMLKEKLLLTDEQTEKFKEMVKAHTVVEGNLIISDLRGVDPIYSGNRFMIYSMYPEQNISTWIVSGRGGAGCSAAVGYSILNRTATIDVGSLMLKYNGGGHKKVGTCQFSDDNMATELPKMLAELKQLCNA